MNEAPKVYEAIRAVMEDVGKEGISKARKNAQQGYAYRGIDDVYNELNGLLSKHKLVLLPSVVSSEQVERQSTKGGALFYSRLTVDFKLVSAIDGSHDTIRTVGEAMDSADKSSNKAQSAAYKYAAMMLFCIPTEADNDADASNHEVAAQEPKRQVPSKEESRKLYTDLVTDMRRCDTPADMDAWWKDSQCKSLRAQLHPDWHGNLSQDFTDMKKSLLAKIAEEDKQMEGAD